MLKFNVTHIYRILHVSLCSWGVSLEAQPCSRKKKKKKKKKKNEENERKEKDGKNSTIIEHFLLQIFIYVYVIVLLY